MESDAKRAAVDRISVLPGNLINFILERLPLHDAARTSVLSNTWKNIWENHSQLVFDESFFQQLVRNKPVHLPTATKTINSILLRHSGPILKFHLSIPIHLPLHRCQDTDIWIKYVSNNGVRILEVLNKRPGAYKLPCYLFSCLELTNMWLNNCIVHPPLRFGGFCNLKSVKLLDVTITADMSLGLQLEELDLERCKGIEHFECQFRCNNNLTALMIIESGAINWRWFECSHKVQNLGLMYRCEAYKNEKAVDFDNLVGNMPGISTLRIDSYILQLLQPGGADLKKLTISMMNLKNLLLYQIELENIHQIQYVLCLIKSSPNLQNLHIEVKNSQNGTAVAAVEQYLHLPNFTGMILDKLEIVEIETMSGSRAELYLIKILLASAPSLRWMKLKYMATLLDYPKEELRILRELLPFTRASASAQIIFS